MLVKVKKKKTRFLGFLKWKGYRILEEFLGVESYYA